MLTILFRTFFIYLTLYLIMRLMGKRQLGELEITDLVTTLMLSEIASLPITNQELPVAHAIVPMIVLLFLEVLFSVVLIRFPRLKPLVSARPTVLIQNGELDLDALQSQRISMDELIGEIRQQGFPSLTQIDCAIVEKNGKLTLFPKLEYCAVTVGDLDLDVQKDPLMHIVFSNGQVSSEGLRLIKKSEKWLSDAFSKRKVDVKELFCAIANESGELYLINKKKKEGSR